MKRNDLIVLISDLRRQFLVQDPAKKARLHKRWIVSLA
jgi:hypothetical protein